MQSGHRMVRQARLYETQGLEQPKIGDSPRAVNRFETEIKQLMRLHLICNANRTSAMKRVCLRFG